MSADALRFLMRLIAEQLLCAGAHVLVLSQGSGMLPLLVARTGAGRVTAVERGPMLYRMAKQALASNPTWADTIHLLDRPLSQVTVHGACYLAAMLKANSAHVQPCP